MSQAPCSTDIQSIVRQVIAELRAAAPTPATPPPAAALEILGLTDRIAEYLDVDHFTPMVGQGCVAVECRADDEWVRSLVAHADHAPTRFAVETERTFLAEVGAGCTAPLGAHVSGGTLSVFMASGPEANARRFTSTKSITTSTAHDVARDLAREALRLVQ